MLELIDNIRRIAEKAGELLAGPIVPAAIEIGNQVLDLIDNVKTVVNTNDQAELQAIRDELEPKVLAHADSTEAALRGS